MRTITYNVYKFRGWPEGAAPGEACTAEQLKGIEIADLFTKDLGKVNMSRT